MLPVLVEYANCVCDLFWDGNSAVNRGATFCVDYKNLVKSPKNRWNMPLPMPTPLPTALGEICHISFSVGWDALGGQLLAYISKIRPIRRYFGGTCRFRRRCRFQKAGSREPRRVFDGFHRKPSEAASASGTACSAEISPIWPNF